MTMKAAQRAAAKERQRKKAAIKRALKSKTKYKEPTT
jgi:hypothetical protein